MATAPQPMPSATQPNATTILGAPVALNPAGLKSLGAMLSSRFTQYEQDRKLAELKWTRNARQFLGIYDPEIDIAIDKNRSRAYPKVTRVKCVSMLSRLMNLLFQAEENNWSVDPSAVPDLSEKDLQSVLDKLMPPPPTNGPANMGPPGMPIAPQAPPPSNEAIEQAIRVFAQKRADRLQLEIQDQLQELGGARSIDYVALCRKVIASGIQYGAGVLKGPFIEEQQQRKWQQDGQGRMQAITYTAYRPRFEFVPIWDYYPDMGAKELSQMDGQFQRVVMSKHQLIMLKQRPDFIPDQIDTFLRQSPAGNYRRRAFETELRSMGVQLNTAMTERNKFEAIIWEGHVSGQELHAAGIPVTDAQLEQDVRAQVWMLGDTVIKASIDPWTTLETDGEMPMYHHFIFEDDETFLLGNALPNIVRDSQLGICAATRMMIDNGSIQRVFEINTALIRLDADNNAVQPDKIYYRDDDNIATMQYPAIRPIDIPMKLAEMQGLVKLFQEFADQETFVNAATGGDMQKGPSEPFRTASGASMLRGDAALPFKDVVRNFDMFTESVIGAIITFNKNFNTNPDVKGDFKPVARGATSLIAKEVLGAQLDNFAQTLTDGEKQYVNMRELVRARARVRDLTVDDIVMDDAACDAVDQAAQQAQQAQQAQAQQMAQATIRQLLADALKNIAQAGKNTAAAEATTANVILDALEKGLDPHDLDIAGPENAGAGAAANDSTQSAGAGNGGAAQAAGTPAGAGTGQAAAMPSS
jgi:hypothetical protein